MLRRSAYQSAPPCLPKRPASQSPQLPIVSQNGRDLREKRGLFRPEGRLDGKHVFGDISFPDVGRTQHKSLLRLKDNDSPPALNEILADPAGGANGDANQDGSRSATGDEFIEIYNTSSSAAVDLSGYELQDGVGTRHVCPGGTSLGPETSAVVFGGGVPASSVPGLVQTASTGSLGLNNGGDTVTLTDGSGTGVLRCSYDGSVSDESITRSPDLTGGLIAHSSAAGSSGAPFLTGADAGGRPAAC